MSVLILPKLVKIDVSLAFREPTVPTKATRKSKHSTGVPDVEHLKLLNSVEAREARRQAQLAKLPVTIGSTMRGRIREQFNVFYPYVLSKDMTVSLGKRLKRKNEILRDQFTVNIPTLLLKGNYDQYVMGGNKHNKRFETDPEDQKQAVLALQRQTQHVADKLHHDTWLEWQMARLFNAGLGHVLTAVHQDKTPRKEALLLTASATEDLGFCLQDNPTLQGLWGGSWLPKRYIEIGQHAASEPRSLLAQHPETLLVVKREQERREEFWHDSLVRYEDPVWGGDRRTTQDNLDEVLNDTLIAQLQVKV